jgi:phosphate starvation-inducible PhoH-like protein
MRKKGGETGKAEDFVPMLSSKEKLLTRIRFSLKCKNERQKKLVRLINQKEITICAGPAGTGKTYLACAEALRLITTNTATYKKILLVKSVTVLPGEEVGFLKGTLKDKMEPFMVSFIDNFEKIIGVELTQQLMDAGVIEIQPLTYIRGRSIDNSIIIIDEAQNITMSNMRSAMTRIGEDSKMVIIGDTKQIDISKKLESSLDKICRMFSEVDEIGITHFERADIVRNPLIIKIDDIFDQEETLKARPS